MPLGCNDRFFGKQGFRVRVWVIDVPSGFVRGLAKIVELSHKFPSEKSLLRLAGNQSWLGLQLLPTTFRFFRC